METIGRAYSKRDEGSWTRVCNSLSLSCLPSPPVPRAHSQLLKAKQHRGIFRFKRHGRPPVIKKPKERRWARAHEGSVTGAAGSRFGDWGLTGCFRVQSVSTGNISTKQSLLHPKWTQGLVVARQNARNWAAKKTINGHNWGREPAQLL